MAHGPYIGVDTRAQGDEKLGPEAMTWPEGDDTRPQGDDTGPQGDATQPAPPLRLDRRDPIVLLAALFWAHLPRLCVCACDAGGPLFGFDSTSFHGDSPARFFHGPWYMDCRGYFRAARS